MRAKCHLLRTLFRSSRAQTMGPASAGGKFSQADDCELGSAIQRWGKEQQGEIFGLRRGKLRF